MQIITNSQQIYHFSRQSNYLSLLLQQESLELRFLSIMSNFQRLHRRKAHESEEYFAKLYNTHYAKLYRLAYYITSDEEICKDVLSIFFLKVWEKIETFKQAKDIENYLFISLRNETLTYLKRQKNSEYCELKELLITQEDTENLTPHETLQLKETNQILDSIIEELPEKRKRVFKLSRYENKTAKEIAQICNISTKTVEDHIRKSLIFLRHHSPKMSI